MEDQVDSFVSSVSVAVRFGRWGAVGRGGEVLVVGGWGATARSESWGQVVGGGEVREPVQGHGWGRTPRAVALSRVAAWSGSLGGIGASKLSVRTEALHLIANPH